MKSNSLKSKTILSFFSSAATKKQKLDGCKPSFSSKSAETETRLVSSEGSNLLSAIVPINDMHADSISTCSHHVSNLSSTITSCSLRINSNHSFLDSTSHPVSSSVPSPLLPTDNYRSLTDSPLQPVSPLLPLLPLFPIDISRSSADPPAQPILPSYKFHSDNRSFKKQWFINRPWFEYSIDSDRIFCYYCRHFGSTNNMINRNQSDAFLRGFNDLKIAREKKKD
ncbi:unnamed protein product [Rotaria sp. Silwood2]|nr:unnamed protein product [Rotaria sp. Silwood2]CAF3363183.1 unnamed protein product [Rotaria sp. Silwood2]CAF4318871.1 unnamed protein product [Rotaria sp. Silwood2]CAF4477211.1 unnamed protein product [Rotaria sp. Silwood2]